MAAAGPRLKELARGRRRLPRAQELQRLGEGASPARRRRLTCCRSSAAFLGAEPKFGRKEPMRPILVLALIGLAPASLVQAGDVVLLIPGRYEVSVRLDLPNIEGAAASTLRTLCVPAQDQT